MLLLSESRTTNDMNLNELKLNEYILFRCDAQNRYTGGVLIYTHESISAYEVFKYDSNQIWALAIQVVCGYAKEIFCVVYRGHKAQNENFLDFFEDMCNKLIDVSCKINIVGDFNYDFFKHPYARKIMKVAKIYNLKQLIVTPSREDSTSSSTIDWFLTNNKNVKCDMDCEDIITDHKIICANFFHKNKFKPIYKQINDYSNYSKNVILTKLSEVNWQNIELIENINDKANILICKLKEIIDSVVQKRNVKSNVACKWFNSDLKKMKKQKIDAYVCWVNDKNLLNQNIYKHYRNKYKDELKQAESNYIQMQLMKNKNDTKKLWQIMKSCYADKDKEPLNAVKFDKELICESQEIANKLNAYFIESIEELVSKVPFINVDVCIDLSNVDNEKFYFEYVSCEYVRDTVKQLKDKSFYDNINGKFLNDAVEHQPFLQAFTNLINDSLESGIVPDIFKCSIIAPIKKIKNSNDHSDLRPINQLPVYNKVLEIIVRKQVNDYFEKNNIFIPEQSGFRSKYSCESALNLILHEWKVALDNKKIIIAVFIDLKRAFETIDRKLLIEKLKMYGCCDVVLNWFKSYLSDRKQITKFKNDLSNELFNSIGIPQGGTLSCLLFIIFINDMKLYLKEVKIKLFADDTLLYVECDRIDDGIKKMNNDLNNVFKYLCHSKLVLNNTKSKAMVITNRNLNVNNIEIKINDKMLEVVDEIKYLGVFIDSKLNFNRMTDHVCGSLIKKYYLLKRCCDKLSRNSKITYYKSLVLPSIDYCSSLMFSCNRLQINKIQVIQNRFLRLILRSNRETRISSMLDELDLMSVKQRIYFNAMNYMNKLINGNGPDYLTSKIKKRNDRRERNLRNDNEYYIGHGKKNLLNESFLIKGLSLYNDIQKHFSKAQNLSFKTFLNNYIKKNFPVE